MIPHDLGRSVTAVVELDDDDGRGPLAFPHWLLRGCKGRGCSDSLKYKCV